jgi:hypothetical protein
MKILIRSGEKGKWQLVQSVAYGAEANLQRLLAEEPSLITISEAREGSSALVRAIREFPLDIGSIDILAFTADGNIAIIECKLAGNEEIKRKVISQVFEYGANLWKMSYETLNQKVLSKTNKNLADFVREGVEDPEWSEEDFRANIAASLQNGNFILMIVVDEVSEYLSRIISFINSAGNPAFSLSALEMRRFQHKENEMLVPHVFGLIDKNRRIGNAGNRKKWDETSYFADVHANLKPPATDIIRNLFEWSKEHGDSIGYGSGGASGSFTFYYEREGNRGSVFSIYSTGFIAINFGYMKKIYSDEQVRQFSSQLALIPSMKEADSTKQFYLNLAIDNAFSKPEYLEAFKNEVLALKNIK